MTSAPAGCSSPRVRVVVVNYNGGSNTIACLRTLLDSDWPADQLEIVLVDNASSDGIVEEVRGTLPQVRVVEAGDNVGFGAGCNLALRSLEGIEYVALINNDVTVPPEWLRPLVECLESDPTIGAASPKILLQDRYREIILETSATSAGGLDRRRRGVHLSDVRVEGESVLPRSRFRSGWWGPEPARDGTPGQWSMERASLLVPSVAAQPTHIAIRLSTATTREVRVHSGAASMDLQVGTSPASYAIPNGGDPFDVINNAGTELVAHRYAADRGYLESDAGQYDAPADVFAWCGAAVLLRASYLHEVGLFDESLFLYYEDVDLSWRGRRAGWTCRYVPESVVRHVHSAATSTMPEEQLSTLKERNHLIVVTRYTSPATALRTLAEFMSATAGIARRDVLGPWTLRERARTGALAARTMALRGFVGALPRVLADRQHSGASEFRPAAQ